MYISGWGEVYIEHLTVVMITISINLAYDASTLKVTDFYEHSTLNASLS